MSGDEAPYTLTAMGNLGVTYAGWGREQEAEELAVRVMEINVRLYGDESADTLCSMSNLAASYARQDRWREAECLAMSIQIR